MNMRTWNDRLFLDAMPGRYSPLSDWITEVVENHIDVIVCLAAAAEIQKKSPDYADLRRKRKSHDGRTLLPVGDREIVLIDFPIEDYSVPADGDVEQFWLLATEIAHRVAEGFRVFVHCGAGIGRTGTFAAAVLMMMGRTADKAREEIARTDSRPERPAQHALLDAGIPPSFTPPDIDRDPITYAEWTESHRQLVSYRLCEEFRPRSGLTRQYGLRVFLDAQSEGWNNSSRDDKLAALSSVCLDDEFRMASTQIYAILISYPSGWISEDQLIVSASLLLQSAIDPEFAMQNAHRSAKNADAPDLGRYVFDSMSSEGESVSPEEKLSRIRTEIDAGYSVLDLVTAYLDRFGHRKELRTQAVCDLFALAVST